MKPSTGWIVFVITLCGLGYWFATSGRLHYPPPDIAALELARGDIERSRSCLTVDQVLKANGFTNNVWTSRVRNEWTMRVEPGGHSWRTYTFTVENGRLEPMMVVSSDDLPQIDLKPAIDEWIEKIHAPAAESCLQRAGQGS